MAAPDRHTGIWTGLLKWSLAQHNVEPVSNAKPMSEEDKQFLRGVFDSLVVDEVKRMKIIVEILRMPEDEAGIKRLVGESATALQKLQEVAPGRTEGEHYGMAAPKAAAANTLAPPASPAALRSPSPTLSDYQHASIPDLAREMLIRKEGALEELDDRCLTSDNANDFMTIGGLQPLLMCLVSKYDGIRWRAAQAISTITQNNPKAQKRVFEEGALDYLVPLLTPPAAGAAASSASASSSDGSSGSEAWTVVVKALTAISALIRSDDQPNIREAFMAGQGLQRLVSLLVRQPPPTERVQTKVLNLLRHVFAWFPSSKAQAIQLGLLPVAVASVGRSADIGHREAAVRMLLEFVKPTGDKEAQAVSKELRKKEYGLKEGLAHRIKALKALKSQEDKEQAEEELTLSTALSKACKF